MSKKVLPLLIIVFIVGLFLAFRSRGSNNNNKDIDVLAKQQQLLAAIGTILEQKHYSPRVIDDSFSKVIFKGFLDDLDPDKDLFLQSDINELKKYETTIDDEIHGAPILFYPSAVALNKQRTDEASAIYKNILATPFDFTKDETVEIDGDKLQYPANETERNDVWRKRLKYLTLEQFVFLQNQRDKSTVDSIKHKTDAVLEKEARSIVLKSMNRSFERQQKTFNEEEQFSAFVNIITEAMDPHTTYFAPVEKRGFDEDMSGRFYGIGAQLTEEDGAIKIASLITGSPAWKSGKVQVNDVIVKVAQGSAEPVDVSGYAVTDAVKIIRGTKGTEVKLFLKKQDGTIQMVSLIRDEIVQDESFARSVVVNNNGKKIGYIYLPEFYVDFERPNGARCSVDVANEIKKLKAENIDGIVLDLRNNGGGSLPEVVQMVGLFVKGGPIVQVKDRDGNPAILSADNDTPLYNGPLAVMVNELSASASEIFVAAIQDYKRGIIIGSTSTYGKGTVQKSLPLGRPIDMNTGATEYGALKLTFEKFYRVNGGSTQLKGVTPDVVLPDSYEYLKFREKDNPFSLSWDQVQKANFTPWADSSSYTQVIAKSDARVKNDAAFNSIKTNTAWLSNNTEKQYDLNITKYKARQQLIKSTVQKSDTLAKLAKPMDITINTVDRDKFYNNPDKVKGDRYQRWYNDLKNDLYVNESVKIVTDMINTKPGVINNMVSH